MSPDNAPISLDRLVTKVATRLMAANAATSVQVSTEILGVLVAYFDVDVSFLRHNDHSIGASILVAEWPLRTDVPQPDPLAVVYFANADPVFALAEHSKSVLVFRPDNGTTSARSPRDETSPRRP